MKILCVVEHGNAPSTRLRLRDCLDYYAGLGVKATVVPTRRSSVTERLRVLKEARRHDVVVLFKTIGFNEFELGLEANAPYDSFRVRVSANIEKLTTVLKTLRQAGKRLHIYGASTKGNTILQACGLDRSTLECAADRNPEKHGAHIIGSEIPIVSEEESRSMNPDYYLVLPWHFKAEFLQREQETLKRGVGMIFPLPDVDIVTWSNLPSQK